MEKVKKIFKELIPYFVIIIAIVLIRTYIITPVRVDGRSMNPTLENNEILILKKFDKKYERFEIIVFKNNNDKLVKRIIGLPGETVEIKDNKLYINGEYVEETFKHLDTPDYKLDGVIPEDMYFVLGDNRTNSLDSRYIGLISKDNIEGTIDLSIYPFKKLK